MHRARCQSRSDPPARRWARRLGLACAAAALHGLGGRPALAEPPGGEEAAAIARREEWRRSKMSTYMNDFGELGRYRAANARLAAPAAGERRVVFFGDSITDRWRLDQYFPGQPYVNRGIGGQTTPQMVVRFRQDVIELYPRIVVILAGTNDIAGSTGPMSLEDTEGELTSMAELARASGIHVLFSSILPVHDHTPAAKLAFPLRPPEKIRTLNRWLKDYCAGHGAGYVDYFSAMVDDKGWLKRELAEDGLHPNAAGYAVMAPIVAGAIERALAILPGATPPRR